MIYAIPAAAGFVESSEGNVPDGSHGITLNVVPGQGAAQVFESDYTGKIKRVELYLYRFRDVDLVVDIRTLLGGEPHPTAFLDSVRVEWEDIVPRQDWISIIVDFPTGISVSSCYEYAVVLRTHNTTGSLAYLWDGDNDDTITGSPFSKSGGGNWIEQSGGDMGLRIFFQDADPAPVGPSDPTVFCVPTLEEFASAPSCQVDLAPEDFVSGWTDDDPVAPTFTLSPQGPYGVGQHNIQVTATDQCGRTATCNTTLNVYCTIGSPVHVGDLRVFGQTVVDSGGGIKSVHNSLKISHKDYPRIKMYFGPNAEATVDEIAETITLTGENGVEFELADKKFPITVTGNLVIDVGNTGIAFDGTMFWAKDDGNPGTNDIGLQGSFDFSLGQRMLDVSVGAFANLSAFSGTSSFDFSANFADSCVIFTSGASIETGASGIPVLPDFELPGGSMEVTFDMTNGILAITLDTNILSIKTESWLGQDIGVGGPGGGIAMRYDRDSPNDFLSVRVIEPISIGLPSGSGSIAPTSDTPALHDGQLLSEGIVLPRVEDPERIRDDEESSIISLGLTLLADEDYVDENCNGIYDLGEPFTDEDGNGTWDGRTFFSWDAGGLTLSAQAELGASVLGIFELTVAEADLILDWAERYFELAVGAGGITLGPQNDPWYRFRPVGAGYFRLDFEDSLVFRAKGEFNPGFISVRVDSVKVVLDPATGDYTELAGQFSADANINLMGFFDFELASASGGFRLVDDGFSFNAGFDIPGWFSADADVIMTTTKFEGHLTTGFEIFGYDLVSGSSYFRVSPGSLFISANALLFGCIDVGTVSLTWKNGWSKPKLGAKWGFALCSPLDLHYYDHLGRHVGRNPETGVLEIQIPGATYFEDGDHKYIELPNLDLATGGRVVMEGYEQGTYSFAAMLPSSTPGGNHIVHYENQPSDSTTVIELPISAASEGAMFPLQVDMDGDGNVDSTVMPATHHEEEIDLEAPTISNVAVEAESVDGTTASVTWTTNLPLTTQVHYGLDTSYGQASVADSTPVTDHVVNLAGLTPGTTYHFYAESGEVDTTARIVRSADMTFTTETGSGFMPALITSIDDVANDQGLQVRVQWNRDEQDAAGVGEAITQYSVWHQTAPSTWSSVAIIPAGGDDSYSTVVPTTCDSTASGICWSVFYVRAETINPGTFYNGAPDSGYSVDNLVPSAPGGMAQSEEDPGRIEWTAAPEADVVGYRVYVTSDPDDPAAAQAIGQTEEAGFELPLSESARFVFVTAVDDAGNESEPSAIVWIPPNVGTVALPTATRLLSNAPNPFATTTAIAFDLAKNAHVQIGIYDIAGRLVRHLVDGSLPASRHSVVWDRRDESGRKVGAGVYFYRMVSGDYAKSRTMVILD